MAGAVQDSCGALCVFVLVLLGLLGELVAWLARTAALHLHLHLHPHSHLHWHLRFSLLCSALLSVLQRSLNCACMVPASPLERAPSSASIWPSIASKLLEGECTDHPLAPTFLPAFSPPHSRLAHAHTHTHTHPRPIPIPIPSFPPSAFPSTQQRRLAIRCILLSASHNPHTVLMIYLI